MPASVADVGFVNHGDGNGGDYHLPSDQPVHPTSPYKGAATDGTDLGANIDAVKAAIAGVE